MNSSERYLTAAVQIGYQMISRAIFDGEYCNWQAYSYHPITPEKQKPTMANLRGNFYEGLLGISFFMGMLYQNTNNEDFKEMALRTLRTAEKQGFGAGEKGSLSLYTGTGGLIFVRYILGSYFRDESLKKQAMETLKNLATTTTAISGDLLSGAVGLLPFLLKIKQAEGGLPWLDAIIARTAEYTLAEGKNQNLLGMAHGSSGFIYALCALYEHTRDERYIREASELVSKEDITFQESKCNWPDLREGVAPLHAYDMWAWCHGAPGLLLARARYHQQTSTTPGKAYQLARAALEQKLDQPGEINNLSLCHGLCGNAEILFLENQTGNTPQALENARKIAGYVIDNYLDKQIPLPSGGLENRPNPSLMLGDAGVGIYLLRCFDPENWSPLLSG